MQIFEQGLKYKFKKVVSLVVVFFVLVGLGCTSTKKTTKTETASSTSNVVVTNPGDQGTTSTVTTSPQDTKTTTTTTETKPTGHPGILSSTVHAIGWVIALPFRLIGGLIGWIF